MRVRKPSLPPMRSGVLCRGGFEHGVGDDSRFGLLDAVVQPLRPSEDPGADHRPRGRVLKLEPVRVRPISGDRVYHRLRQCQPVAMRAPRSASVKPKTSISRSCRRR